MTVFALTAAAESVMMKDKESVENKEVRRYEPNV